MSLGIFRPPDSCFGGYVRCVGQVIRGRKHRYTVTGVHASGGQSHVLIARSSQGRNVVIKIPHHSVVQHHHKQAWKEAYLLRRLTRANVKGVVRHLDEGTWQGTPFLACELLQGETVEARLRSAAIPLKESLRLFLLLATTLERIHDEGIVHGDVSAPNIMLCNDVPIVLDLGIARELHEPVVAAGTPNYMAPEVVTAIGSPDPCGGTGQDLYSLGILLYEMVMGYSPFRTGENVVNAWYAMAYQHLSIKPPHVELPHVDATVLDPLNALIQALLAKDPAQRPSLAEARILAKEVLYQLEPRNSFTSPPTWFHAPEPELPNEPL